MKKTRFGYPSLQPLVLETDEERDLAGAILAHFACQLYPSLNEYEATEIAQDFLKEAPLDMISAGSLAMMFRGMVGAPKSTKQH